MKAELKKVVEQMPQEVRDWAEKLTTDELDVLAAIIENVGMDNFVKHFDFHKGQFAEFRDF